MRAARSRNSSAPWARRNGRQRAWPEPQPRPVVDHREPALVSHMLDTLERIPAAGQRPSTIESHSEIDLQVEYTGMKGVTLTGGIQNLLDADVPYSSTATSSAFNDRLRADVQPARPLLLPGPALRLPLKRRASARRQADGR